MKVNSSAEEYKSLSEIDFSPLENGEPSEKSNKLQKKWRIVNLYERICLCVFVVVMLIVLIYFQTLNLSEDELLVAFSLVMMLIIACFHLNFIMIKYLKKRFSTKNRKKRIEDFAAANNGVYIGKSSAKDLVGTAFKAGESPYVAERVVLKNGIAMGRYFSSSGQQQTDGFSYVSFVAMHLNRKLPHVYVDAKSNNFIGQDLKVFLKKNQLFEVETQLSKHFNLFVPEGYERDILYLFTPDVLSVVENKGCAYDVEIIDNMIYVLSSMDKSDLANATEAYDIITYALELYEKINKQSTNYKDERVQPRNIPTTITTPVGIKGKRLSHSINILEVFVVICLVATLVVMIVISYLN